MPAVAVALVPAKRGDFDLADAAGPQDGDHAKGGPDRQGAAAAEQLANLVRRGVGGDVVILGGAT